VLTSQPRPSRPRFVQSGPGRIALLSCASLLAPASLPLLRAAPARTSKPPTSTASTSSTAASTSKALPSKAPRAAKAPKARRAQSLSGRTAAISINGKVTPVVPEPVITSTGSVLVPLRGVLEKLQAKVTYVSSDRRIEVRQNGKLFVLREGQKSAASGTELVVLPAAPQRIGGSVYVPLRSLVELFGYRIEWDNAAKSVLIDTESAPLDTLNHREALNNSRRFGVGIDFSQATLAEVPLLLDSAKATGVDMVQTRFDWNTVQPLKGGSFDFSLYDEVVAQARKRNMIVVGILGTSARWASQTSSENPFEWRFNAPRKTELPSWSAYVRATVAHFRSGVHAWQIWEQPTSWKLRASGYSTYSELASLALLAARKADPKAILHAAEPGGVNLTYLNALRNDAALSALDGVSLFPASQWQPGLPVPPEDEVLPLAAYQSQLQLGRDVWLGGLWYPAIERQGVAKPGGAQFSRASDTRREQIFNAFSPQDQADFLAKSAALAVASGAGKVLWNTLRDDAQYETVEPVNPEWGTGLLRADNSPRPAYNALATLARLIGDPKFQFIGALSAGPDVVALAFDNGEMGHVLAWSPSGQGKITVNDTQDPKVPGAVYIGARADSQFLFANGDPASPSGGALSLSARPIWITRIAADTAARAKSQRSSDSKYLQISRPLPRATEKGLGHATFGSNGEENGLLWRKYELWRGQATRVEQKGGEATVVMEVPPDILHPADGKPFLFFDVADDLAFFTRTPRGTPTVTVRVHKAVASASGALSSNTAGFKIEYSTLNGPRSSRWQQVEDGEGFVQYSFDLPGASFGNTDGSDFTINAFGSKQNLFVSSVSLALNNS